MSNYRVDDSSNSQRDTVETSLLQNLKNAGNLLSNLKEESELSEDEISACVILYQELRRLLSRTNRMGDPWLAKASTTEHKTTFRERYKALIREFDEAEEATEKVNSIPAAVRPLSLQSIQDEVRDFFILDNSLRETTVGAPRGHTLEEKHKIVRSIAETGLEEIILGSYGSKISVDSQIAEQWRSLGKTFDSTWGFSDAYDFEPFDEGPIWETNENSIEQEPTSDYFTPKFLPKHDYSKQDTALFLKASKGFRKGAFKKSRLRSVLKRSQSKVGRIPMGLLMMAGYGICNAIIEVDASLETFDYQKYDIVERFKFLICWCKENFPMHINPKTGKEETARVFVNLRDFTNFYRSEGGTEEALQLVDALSRLPPEERPFGFMMEEPTGWLFPSEVGRLCRMVRLTMERAGFSSGRFLVHVHWYFGLAESNQLAALCNGADGIWAAVCRPGSQVGHACSTMTAVNLYRAGITHICDKYDLAKMCVAAREVHAVTTRAPCPTNEEIYGSQAFDIPYFMLNLPSCRYSIYRVLNKIGASTRLVRLNEISLKSSVYKAMVHHFGPPSETKWEPIFCDKMFEAIHNHLLTGLSRDYNTPLGLGHLYSLISRKALPTGMIQIMTERNPITNLHPVVLDFTYRWNRLCDLYNGNPVEDHPAANSKSMMLWGIPVTTKPRQVTLPFEFFTADVMRNPVLEQIPNLFKLQVVNLLTNDERRIQGKPIPEINYYETTLRLKLFIEEASSLHVLGLVDDFCIRKNHDFFFGEENLWLKDIHSVKPQIANKILLSQMTYYKKYYKKRGDTAILRCIEAAALRISEHRSLPKDMGQVFDKKESIGIVNEILEEQRSCLTITKAHEKMITDLAADGGQDEILAKEYFDEIVEMGDEPFEGTEDSSSEFLGQAYIEERRRSILNINIDDIIKEDIDNNGDEKEENHSNKKLKARKRNSFAHVILRNGSDALRHVVNDSNISSSNRLI